MSARYPQAVGVDVIATHTAELVTLASTEPLTTPVPSCGGWSLADLVWHVTEVQDFWAYIIRRRPAGPDEYSAPERSENNSLPARLRQACADLTGALSEADPADRAWSWAAEQTVGFTIRRQSHEALIHHLDGVLALDRELPTIDPELAADGVDELIDVMVCRIPDWAHFDRTSGAIRLTATDTGDSWNLAFGTMTGLSPDTGTSYDVDACEVSRSAAPDTVVSAPAVHLDLWMWGRQPLGVVETAGDPSLIGRIRGIVSDATQ